MCTVTWWQSADLSTYEVFFNRDELRSRGLAAPPAMALSRHTDYLAPQDANYGGTWLLVNTHGVSLALLNYYPDEAAEPDIPRSRGKLLHDLADVSSLAALASRLTWEDLSCYGAFSLVAFNRGELPRQWVWDTQQLQEVPLPENLPMLTSSAQLILEIENHRRECFARECSTSERRTPHHLAQFHLHREPDRPAYGILMDRPDARTMSISHLKVGPGPAAVFTYQTRPPEDGALPEPAVTARLVLSR